MASVVAIKTRMRFVVYSSIIFCKTVCQMTATNLILQPLHSSRLIAEQRRIYLFGFRVLFQFFL
jgi:hypothetical protein